jgi:hypothetical protein
VNESDAERWAAAKAEIHRLKGEVARLAEENRAFLAAMRHMTSASDEVLADARKEAAETREKAASEAYERLVVARADARAAVHEERHRAASELALLAAVRVRVTEERAELTQFQSQLNTHLRHLMHAMVDFTERAPVLEPVEPITLVDPVPPMPAVEERVPLDVNGHTLTNMPAITVDPAADADEELEQAFRDFFGDGDVEPSRSWILND